MSQNSALPENGTAAAGRHQAHKTRKDGQVSPADRKLLGTASAILTVGAAVVQVAGTNGESPARSITLAALTVAIGTLLLLGVTRLAHAWHKHISVSVLLAAGLMTMAGLTGGTAGYLIAHASRPGPPGSGARQQPGPSRNTGTAQPGHSPADPSPRPATLYPEITDNENGTPVFGSAQGRAVTHDESIPFDRRVLVKCWAPNESAMTSVNAFYLVETAPWSGDYAPADTFADGDPVGQSGSTTIDPAVPECH